MKVIWKKYADYNEHIIMTISDEIKTLRSFLSLMRSNITTNFFEQSSTYPMRFSDCLVNLIIPKFQIPNRKNCFDKEKKDSRNKLI